MTYMVIVLACFLFTCFFSQLNLCFIFKNTEKYSKDEMKKIATLYQSGKTLKQIKHEYKMITSDMINRFIEQENAGV